MVSLRGCVPIPSELHPTLLLPPGMRFLQAFVFFLLLTATHCIILAKSKLSVCENTGGEGADPYNIVEGKKCQKKLIVTLSVTNGQNATEMIYANVTKVRDDTSDENARLYNPFIITISKSPVTLVYPYYYTGFVVNNKPYEEIRFKGSPFNPESRTDCNDKWESDNDDTSCGFSFMEKRAREDRKSSRIEKVWDSQGFCCYCSERDKWRSSFGYDMPYFRGGMTCKLGGKHQASAHCMRMDKLWYTVHEIGFWQMDFTVHVKALDQVEKIVNNVTIVDYVDGGEIVLGPKRRSGTGLHNRIVAHFIGEFQATKQFPVLSERYLFIPEVTAEINPKTHQQVKPGPEKYLIMPRDLVDLYGHTCNKIGVTYTAFRNQATDGFGFGCRQRQGYCLYNQPKDFWMEDEEKLKEGKQPRYFTTRYGKLVGVNRQLGNKQFALAYETEEVMTSMLSLQISADDIILVYNRATGEIVSASVIDFQAMSANGKLFVDILNTGYVTADFYVIVPDCSEGIGDIHEKGSSINPQLTKTFGFPLNVFRREGTVHFCIVQLYDSQRKLLDTKNVTFKTFTPCVCIPGCSCTCDSEGMSCNNPIEEGVVIKEDDDWSFGWLDSIVGFFKSIINLPLSLLKFVEEYKVIVAAVLGLLAVGLAKAFLVSNSHFAFAKIGMSLLASKSNSQPKPSTKIVYERDDKGELVPIEVATEGHSGSSKLAFLYNVFFFVLLPLYLLLKLLMVIGEKLLSIIKARLNKIDFQKLGQKMRDSEKGKCLYWMILCLDFFINLCGSEATSEQDDEESSSSKQKPDSPSAPRRPPPPSQEKREQAESQQQGAKVVEPKLAKKSPKDDKQKKNRKKNKDKSANSKDKDKTAYVDQEKKKKQRGKKANSLSPVEKKAKGSAPLLTPVPVLPPVPSDKSLHHYDNDAASQNSNSLPGEPQISTTVGSSQDSNGTYTGNVQYRPQTEPAHQIVQGSSKPPELPIVTSKSAQSQVATTPRLSKSKPSPPRPPPPRLPVIEATTPNDTVMPEIHTASPQQESQSPHYLGVGTPRATTTQSSTEDQNTLNPSSHRDLDAASFYSVQESMSVQDLPSEDESTSVLASPNASTATVIDVCEPIVEPEPSVLTESDIESILQPGAVCFLNMSEPTQRWLDALIDPGGQFSFRGRIKKVVHQPGTFSFELNPISQQTRVRKDGTTVGLQQPHSLPWNLLRVRLTLSTLMEGVSFSPQYPCLNDQTT